MERGQVLAKPGSVTPLAALNDIAGVVTVVNIDNGFGAAAAAYGTRVTFAKNRTIAFPDFQLEYRGSRRVTPPQFPRGGAVYRWRRRLLLGR